MKQFFRITAALLAAAFLLALTGCGSSSSAPSFTWFVDTIPANLDPQVASAAPDVIACENLYSGLVRKKADGEIVPDLSESWTVSSDGRTYTFQIKDGLTYKAVKGASTDHTITAEDFVFAFRRIFQPQTNSPYAVEFAALENSAAVLAGTADASTLGVSAAGPLTLVFRLSEKDDNFLAKLTLPGAMPCDEAFFESTRGTYGLTAKTTLSSGSFYLYNWTASGLFLRRDVSSPMIGSLRLVQNTGSTGKSAAQLIADEKCSAALDDTGEDTSLQSVDYSDTTWALLFNSAEDSMFANQELRQALAGIADAGGEGLLHKGVHILGIGVDLQPAGCQIVGDGCQTVEDVLTILFRDDALLCQHGGVHAAAAHILRDHALVEPDGGVEVVHAGIHGLGKTALPELFCHSFILYFMSKPSQSRLAPCQLPRKGEPFHLPETGFLRVKKSFIFIAHKARPSGELAKP